MADAIYINKQQELKGLSLAASPMDSQRRLELYGAPNSNALQF